MPRNNLFALFALVLLGLPLIEIALFIWVGREIGVLPTIALTVLSTIVGTSLARIEGFATLRALDTSLRNGETPVKEVLSGALVVIGGILLALPGFFTDILGLFVLIRPVRLWLCDVLLNRFFANSQGSFRNRSGPKTIEVTAIEIDGEPR